MTNYAGSICVCKSYNGLLRGESTAFSATLILLAGVLLHGMHFLTHSALYAADTYGYVYIAQVLKSDVPFVQSIFYFPPGYALLLMPFTSRQLLAAEVGPTPSLAVLVVVQHALVLASGIMIYDAIRREARPRAALSAGLLVVCNPSLMHWAQVMYTEVLTSALLTSALYTVCRAVRARSVASTARWMALCGVAIAWAGSTRTVPYAVGAVLSCVSFWMLRTQHRFRHALAVSLLPGAACACTYLAWCAYMFYHTNRFEHTFGSGRHLYNRVVYTDGTIASGSPATDALVSLIGMESVVQPHWKVCRRLQEHGLSETQAVSLMGRVASESFRKAPLVYFVGTVRLFLRYWFATPERMRGAPVTAVSAPSLERAEAAAQTLLYYICDHRCLGPLALVGALALVLRRGDQSTAGVLAFGVLLTYNGLHAAAEWASLRFMIPCMPCLAVLAVNGLTFAGEWLRSDG